MIELSSTGFAIKYGYEVDTNGVTFGWSVHYNPARDVWAATLSCGPIYFAMPEEPRDSTWVINWMKLHTYQFMTPGFLDVIRSVIDGLTIECIDFPEPIAGV